MDIKEYSYNIQKKSGIFADLVSVSKSLLFTHEIAREAKEYLLSRMFKNIPGFIFGYFPSNDNLHLLYENKILKQEDLEKVGVVYTKYIFDGGFPQKTNTSIMSKHNLIMQYKNLYGDIIGIVGRTLIPNYEELKISKYKNSTLSKGLNLFGFYNAKKEILNKDTVILVEGQFDCITCHRYGIKNVVAIGGTSFTKFHLFMILRYTNNIILLLDNDGPGIAASERIIKLNEMYGSPAIIKSVCVPQEYKDIDEFFVKDNDVAIRFMKSI